MQTDGMSDLVHRDPEDVETRLIVEQAPLIVAIEMNVAGGRDAVFGWEVAMRKSRQRRKRVAADTDMAGLPERVEILGIVVRHQHEIDIRHRGPGAERGLDRGQVAVRHELSQRDAARGQRVVVKVVFGDLRVAAHQAPGDQPPRCAVVSITPFARQCRTQHVSERGSGGEKRGGKHAQEEREAADERQINLPIARRTGALGRQWLNCSEC